MRPLLIAAILLCCGLAQAEEIQLPNTSEYTGVNFNIPFILNSPVVFNSLGEIPYDFAKNFPPELYYWWAKAHNAREYEKLPPPIRRTPIVRSTTHATQSTSIKGRTNLGCAVGTRFSTNQYKRTYTQEFRKKVGVGPAMIYNPYFR